MALQKKKTEAAHYVDKKRFYEDIAEWKIRVSAAKDSGKEPPQPPAYVSHALMNIVMGMSKMNNFKNYTYLDEMISDALENVVMALPSFDPEKGTNPFGYFSLVVYYAFLRRIDKEKKQTYIKYKITENMSLHNDLNMGTEIGEKNAIDDILSNEKMMDLVYRIEKKDEDKKTAKKPSSIKSGQRPKRNMNTVWLRKGHRRENP